MKQFIPKLLTNAVFSEAIGLAGKACPAGKGGSFSKDTTQRPIALLTSRGQVSHHRVSILENEHHSRRMLPCYITAWAC